ncbi:hypothetical protein DM01DRAFT_1376007 [Hesseltinella vesiculosa]|uniref:Uncharacterized protein n=1 Tax=Hesseltinella vesiculosa TaxID=101127 RepID=A0A1X2GBS8_9FUNG|nr:hypothetical protein DM01DRAFT_1376007 [Hesseltinella vesiculosa]
MVAMQPFFISFNAETLRTLYLQITAAPAPAFILAATPSSPSTLATVGEVPDSFATEFALGLCAIAAVMACYVFVWGALRFDLCGQIKNGAVCLGRLIDHGGWFGVALFLFCALVFRGVARHPDCLGVGLCGLSIFDAVWHHCFESSSPAVPAPATPTDSVGFVSVVCLDLLPDTWHRFDQDDPVGVNICRLGPANVALAGVPSTAHRAASGPHAGVPSAAPRTAAPSGFVVPRAVPAQVAPTAATARGAVNSARATAIFAAASTAAASVTIPAGFTFVVPRNVSALGPVAGVLQIAQASNNEDTCSEISGSSDNNEAPSRCVASGDALGIPR